MKIIPNPKKKILLTMKILMTFVTIKIIMKTVQITINLIKKNKKQKNQSPFQSKKK